VQRRPFPSRHLSDVPAPAHRMRGIVRRGGKVPGVVGRPPSSRSSSAWVCWPRWAPRGAGWRCSRPRRCARNRRAPRVPAMGGRGQPDRSPTRGRRQRAAM
jgi:hypothetical protein